jgi:hypothetical protein
MFVVHANLDCEARWAGRALPADVLARISLYGALVTALAPADAEVELWSPAAIDPQKLALPWPIALRTGTPPHADLAWADDAAKAVNDRRLALALAPVDGARVIDRLAGDWPDAWVAKAPWTAAGRDRVRGRGTPTGETLRALDRLLGRSGALVLEPWHDRIVDAGVCARVDRDGTITQQPPHTLLVDARGAFLGIALAEPALAASERAELVAHVDRAGRALAERGYAGPFAVDAYAYTDHGARKLRPLCEINARYSFGWVARALDQRFASLRDAAHARLGTHTLGFGAPPPTARLLIAPPTTAWIV